MISVYSPYTPDAHVIVIETSKDRYLPSLEWVLDAEGERVVKLWYTVLDFFPL